jgi:Phage regulatory protein CII (CP76).
MNLSIGIAAGSVYANPNTLKHKLNPNNVTHHLTLRDALTMQVLTGRHDILYAMADELGEVCTPATPIEPRDEGAELQRAFVSAKDELAGILARMEALQARQDGAS